MSALKPRILVFFDRIPTPDKDSASVRMLGILKILIIFADIIFVPIYQKPENFAYETSLNQMGVQTTSIFDFERQLKNAKIDFVILSYPFVAQYMIKTMRHRFPAAKIIFDTVDVHFVRLEREFQITGKLEVKRQAKLLKKIETSIAQNADQVWCVTESDKTCLEAVAPFAKIEIIPNIHTPLERGKKFAARRDLIFIGGFGHRPNLDAVFYFIKEIFPLIAARKPDVKFHVIGSDPPPEIAALATDKIVVHGFVPDIEPLFAASRVFVAPLRYGGGMKGKVGQALALGLPVVTTSTGAEGMNLGNEREVLIADDADQFVRAVLRVYDDEWLWQTLSDNGYEFIAEHFSPKSVEKTIRSALRRLSPDAEFQIGESNVD